VVVVALSAFPYPGGKTQYVDEVVSRFPKHRRYIEPFGGSAAILLNKPESYVEVFNDLDDDVVQFFRVAREQRAELQEWLRNTPYSESLYNRWQDQFLAGERPDDEIERAGRWFYLRYTSYGGSTGRRAGFKRPGKRNEARSFRGGIQAIDEVVQRLQDVTIANEDYRDILERYDHDESLFYLDPPYLDAGERYYRVADGFDHGALVDALRGLDGEWIVSYDKLPDGLESVADSVETFTARYSLPNATQKAREESTELLAMSFDPSDHPTFQGGRQATLTDGGQYSTDTEQRGETT